MNAQLPPEVSGATSRMVTIDTADAGPVRLHVLEAGAGSPVLMIHGWPQHAGCWSAVMPPLAADHRLICPDLRGFGWSECPPGGYDPFTFAADCAALLDALEIERAHVVGHDWGGAAAFTLALTQPQRVDRMLVLNTMPPWIERSPALVLNAWKSWYAVMLATVGDVVVRRAPHRLARGMRADAVQRDRFTETAARAYAERLREPDRARATKLLYRSYLRLAAERDPRAKELRRLRLTQPTRFLFGANDGAISVHALRGIDKHADDFELELVEDSGHFICDEQPELVAQRARALFAGA